MITRSQIRSLIGLELGLVSFFSILAFFSFGATYWYDSIAYVDMANHLYHLDGLKSYYGSASRNMFQHISYGYPLLWGFIQSLASNYAWMVLAFFQHMIAVLSLVYLSYSFRPFTDKTTRLISLLVLCSSGFYQAFHNSIMTESISTSLLNFGIGSVIMAVTNRGNSRSRFIFVLALLLAPHFRMSIFVILFSLMLIQVVSRYIRLKELVIFSVLSAVSVGLPVMARFYQAGIFFFPNSDYSLPYIAGYSNPEPTVGLLEEIRGLPHPDSISLENDDFFKLGYKDFAVTWDSHLKDLGYSDLERRHFFRDLAYRIKWDNPNSTLNQFVLPFLSLGFMQFLPFISSEHQVRRGMRTIDLLAKNKEHYEWLSWKKGNYHKTFENFLQRFGAKKEGVYQSSSIQIFEQSLSPNIKDKGTMRTLFLGDKIPTDFFIIGSLLFILQVFFLARRTSLIFFTVFLIHWILHVAVGLGNIRYFFPLYPLSIFLTMAFLEAVVKYLQKRFGNKMEILKAS